ncbi:DUF6896 domain-containing protein [Alkanindiges illinoisensis]|uniref:DUF6896 domain-containing protein n=1 Tax=Alkanindiges illinoisensis TaxID=197183 RepID=A0A4Y7XG30_9GAMM|nr:hypothetical protein [Alkanindiges illinoisensis]TEU30811.1 hypothetical protein E2B99_00145 [Alkanindiges illinoisensis]
MDEHKNLISPLISLWYAQIAWAKELLVRSFNLKKAEDILQYQNRGNHQIQGTLWFVRTHGIGVDIYKTPAVGGIDFDFDQPDPDLWRLKIFLERQINDGVLLYSDYRVLIENEDLLDQVIKEILNELELPD